MVQSTKARVLKAIERRGVVRVSPEALEVDDAFAARDPVLAQLAVAAVAGLAPAGPAERKRKPLVLAARGGPEIVGDLVVQDCGFNLHAETHPGAVAALPPLGDPPGTDTPARLLPRDLTEKPPDGRRA